MPVNPEYAALEDTEFSGQLPERLFEAYHRAIFRDAQFDHVCQQISATLEVCEIPHLFMGGICLKTAYPVPAFRTMSDIDVLVKSQDLPSLRKCMCELGATPTPGDGNHRSFLFRKTFR